MAAGTVLQGLLLTQRWRPAPNLSVTKRAEPPPEPQLKHSWNNKACTHNDTGHKKNAGKRSKAKGQEACAHGPSQFRRLLLAIWI